VHDLGDLARAIELHAHENGHHHSRRGDLVDVLADIAGEVRDLEVVVEDCVEMVPNRVDVAQRSCASSRIMPAWSAITSKCCWIAPAWFQIAPARSGCVW
jgi:hypothetical protein